MKPTLFIGSSSEQLETAYAIQRNLERVCEGTVWDQGVFQLSSSALDSLIGQLDRTDFAVFVFGPDDLTTIRDNQYETTRDNVVFELGMFIGKLGKQRTFFVMPRGRSDFRLPSDLLGVMAAQFDDSRSDRQAALGPACFDIRTQISTLGLRQERLAQSDVERIEVKSVLCLSTAPYESLGVEGDIEVLESAFTGAVTSVRSIDLPTLEHELIAVKPDLLHILVSIDENTGELFFPGSRGDELLSSEGFARLVALSKPSLVVLATCDSLFTAHYISRSTNVIAASGDIESDLIVRWERSFYGALAAGVSLSNAFETATTITRAPVILNLKNDFAIAPSLDT